MELEELKPRQSEFSIKSTGRSYKLRPVSLLDEIWLKETFGDKLAEIFSDDIDMAALSRIVYHQIEDRKEFAKQEVTIIDEDGNEQTESLGGAKLLQRMVVGMEDKLNMIRSFNETMGASRPEPSKDSKKKSLPVGN